MASSPRELDLAMLSLVADMSYICSLRHLADDWLSTCMSLRTGHIFDGPLTTSNMLCHHQGLPAGTDAAHSTQTEARPDI